MSAGAGKYLQVAGFDQLAGWHDDNHAQSLAAWNLSCDEITRHGRSFKRKPRFGGARKDWLGLCAVAERLGSNPGRAAARKFFEANFVPVRVSDPASPAGLFTGYYEPEVAGSRKQAKGYDVPLYAKPKDLVAFDAAQRKATGLRYGRIVSGKPRPYLTRKQIEIGAYAGRRLELAWLKSRADAFFMQIQGSGRIRLPDGGTMRLGYAAKSGLPYTAVGAVLVRRGDIPRAQISMQSIRKWMADNPTRARELMWENQSYVFFRELKLKDPGLGPLGAQQVQLTPLRSLAVDRRYWALGTPLWLETRLPKGARFNHLMIAQDTGSAIKNPIRGDIFFGAGNTAADLAGHMQSPGRLFALLPKTTIKRLGLGD
ncbi:MAG: murein transglycosylase A [Hyphomicrobiales bacterium]|nr:murein transglycosylase A [Hyphomicrobiales bacterium]